ncbi:MAG: helix-turn-helix domain-containing protein [Chloroflexi bacterium]|nr:helix-turn-helix domain-containing protein [Chloroflexota bacterium]
MARTSQPDKPTRWLSLKGACDQLGVSETTLRHWADKGQIASFRTPGGHRRFDTEDVARLVERGGKATKDHAADRLGAVALPGIRRRLHQRSMASDSWYRQFDEHDKARMRQMGRRLLDLIDDYVARPRNRQQLLRESRLLGEEYGVEAARSGMPVHDILGAFGFFRRALEETAQREAARKNLSIDEAVAIWRQMGMLVDEALLAATEAFERAAAASDERGGKQ